MLPLIKLLLSFVSWGLIFFSFLGMEWIPRSESCSQTSLIGQDLTESDKPLGPSSPVFLKHILSNSYKGQGNSAGCRQGKLLFVTQRTMRGMPDLAGVNWHKLQWSCSGLHQLRTCSSVLRKLVILRNDNNNNKKYSDVFMGH